VGNAESIEEAECIETRQVLSQEESRSGIPETLKPSPLETLSGLVLLAVDSQSKGATR
jgi:hypothetical protein